MGAQYNSTSTPLSLVPRQVHPLHRGVHWFLSLGDTEGGLSSKIPKNRKRQWCQMLQLDNDDQVLLGSWERGQEYTNDIIENLNHWSTGWTDWNLVLDMNGGDRFDFGFLEQFCKQCNG